MGLPKVLLAASSHTIHPLYAWQGIQEAIEMLHGLPKLDENSPGLWRLKTRVFELLRMIDNSKPAIERAQLMAHQLMKGEA